MHNQKSAKSDCQCSIHAKQNDIRSNRLKAISPQILQYYSGECCLEKDTDLLMTDVQNYG